MISRGTPVLARLDGRLPASADVAIIGGGVAGAATAFQAVRAGLRVVVIERRTELASLTTRAATGAFRLQHDNRDEFELVREGLDLYLDFAARTGLDGWDLGIRQQGYLFCSRSEAAAARARDLVALQRGFGLDDVELISGDEARRRWPFLAPSILQARFRAGDGFMDQMALATGYAVAASNPERIPGALPGGGAGFALGVEVLGLMRGAGGGVGTAGAVTGVRTDRGDLHADTTIIAAGPWSGVVAALAGLHLPIAPTIRERLVIPELAAIDPGGPMTIDDDTGTHWRPALAGCFALHAGPDDPSGEPLQEVPVDPASAIALLDPASPVALANLAPLWRRVWSEGLPAWTLVAGQYENTPDHRPFIGATGIPGLFVNTGYSGHGVMCSAGGARRTIDLLTGRLDGATEPFRLDRPMPARARDVL